MPSKQESPYDQQLGHAKTQVHHANHSPAKSQNSSRLLAYGAVAIVIIIIAVLLIGISLSSSHAATKQPTAPIINTTTVPVSSSGYVLGPNQITVEQFLSKLSTYSSKAQFTINYVGTISTSASTEQSVLTGSIASQYQRYNSSALSSTKEWSNQSAFEFNSISRDFYYSNGTSYYCLSNSITSNYLCHSIVGSPFNISTFGLSAFLGALPGNVLQTPIGTTNSSYDGVFCIAILAKVFNSTNNSGVVLNIAGTVSGCIQPNYKVPLVLNITAVDTESGSYFNGTAQTKIPTESASVNVQLHMVNLTNSSSQLSIDTLPANAVILPG